MSRLFFLVLVMVAGFLPGSAQTGVTQNPAQPPPAAPAPGPSTSPSAAASTTNAPAATAPAPVPVAPLPVVQEFTGTGSSTTGFFKVQDRWEVRWNARQAVSIAVMAADGSIVAGEAGVLRGSIFLPSGGQYYLKISEGILPPSDTPPTQPPQLSWHLLVVQVGTSVASTQKLTVYEPFFVPPDSAINPAPAIPPPPPKLSDEQARAEVIIKGDNAQGTGFLFRTAEGRFVVTNLHLLEANPNVKIQTVAGAPITPVSLKGSPSRGIAMFTIQDANYSYLSPSAEGATAAREGDALVIPEITPGSGGVTSIPGKLVAIGQDQIDFDNALSSGSNGAPVIHAKSGKVLAVVTTAKKLDLTDDLARAWPANSPPGSSIITPFLGQRLTGITDWETYDASKFLSETLFLKQAHKDTRCLDSFLHGRRRRGWNSEEGPPDNRYFSNNADISHAVDAYKKTTQGGDNDQRDFAAKELVGSLQMVADSGFATLQNAANFYACNQGQAKEEAAYRVAIKKELDDLQNNPARLDAMARGH